jgi:prophage regulatory protein
MRLIKLKEVMSISGLGRSSIYKFMAEGCFPQSTFLGGRAVAWVDTEIDDWILARVEERDHQLANNLPKQKKTVISEKDVIAFIQDKFKQFSVAEAIAWMMGCLNH